MSKFKEVRVDYKKETIAVMGLPLLLLRMTSFFVLVNNPSFVVNSIIPSPYQFQLHLIIQSSYISSIFHNNRTTYKVLFYVFFRLIFLPLFLPSPPPFPLTLFLAVSKFVLSIPTTCTRVEWRRKCSKCFCDIVLGCVENR